MIEIEKLDSNKAYSIRFDSMYYVDKPKDFDEFIKTLSAKWKKVEVEYYNGSTIPYDRIFISP
jgi:hypothetical protein